MAMLEDGSRARLQVTTVDTCFQARGLALFGDRQAEARWASCRAYLECFQALGAFDLRYYGVVGSLGIGIVAPFAFALSVRWGESAPKILPGPRLSTGRSALKAYAKAARAECRFKATRGVPVRLRPSGRTGTQVPFRKD
jgi:hypothetical protein